MFHINVWLTVREAGDVDKVRGLLSRAMTLSRRENGCESFDVFHSEADERRFLLCECWSTKDAWEAHREERAFSEIYKPQVLPLVEREPHISAKLEEVDVDA